MCEYNKFELELGSLTERTEQLYSRVDFRKYKRVSVQSSLDLGKTNEILHPSKE